MNELTKNAIESLTPTERAAYEQYLEKGAPPLSPAAMANLFELYLNGNSCEDIAKLNKNFTLGMIARAKVDGLWEERRQAHVRSLLEGVRERVQQVQLESVMFSADLLAAANKLYGDRLKRFLQTGDERELGDLSITSLKQYREAVELLMKLTGQERESKVTVKGEQRHTIEVKPTKAMTPAEAAQILTLVEGGKK